MAFNAVLRKASIQVSPSQSRSSMTKDTSARKHQSIAGHHFSDISHNIRHTIRFKIIKINVENDASFVAACGVVTAAPKEFEVTSLPGWDGPLL
jgi:hypothetical protein